VWNYPTTISTVVGIFGVYLHSVSWVLKNHEGELQQTEIKASARRSAFKRRLILQRCNSPNLGGDCAYDDGQFPAFILEGVNCIGLWFLAIMACGSRVCICLREARIKKAAIESLRDCLGESNPLACCYFFVALPFVVCAVKGN